MVRAFFLLACLTAVWTPAGGWWRSGVRRATRQVQETAVALRQKTEALGAALTQAVESLRVDIHDTLSNIQQKMDTMSEYVTSELGPTVEHALTSTKDSAAEFVERVGVSLDKTDRVMDKTSEFIDVLNILGFVIIGGVCSKILKFDHFVLIRFLLTLIKWASFFTAAVRFSAYLWQLVVGTAPTGRDIAIMVMALIQILTISKVISSGIQRQNHPSSQARDMTLTSNK